MRLTIASEDCLVEIAASASYLLLAGSAYSKLMPERGIGGRLRGLFFSRGEVSYRSESSTFLRLWLDTGSRVDSWMTNYPTYFLIF